MTTRHAQPCRCADCIDGENRLVRPAAIASAAPSSAPSAPNLLRSAVAMLKRPAIERISGKTRQEVAEEIEAMVNAAPSAPDSAAPSSLSAEDIDKKVRDVYIGEGPRGLMMLCKQLLASPPAQAPAIQAPEAVDDDDEIEPADCPKCGGQSFLDAWHREDSACMVRVRCSNCPHYGPTEFGAASEGDRTTIKAWNDAAALATPSAAVSAAGLSIAQEPKYTVNGHAIVNRASGEEIPADEPVFIFRARDAKALAALYPYHAVINDDEHTAAVWARIMDFRTFALTKPERMKEPDTATPAPAPTQPQQGSELFDIARKAWEAKDPAQWWSKDGLLAAVTAVRDAVSPGQIVHCLACSEIIAQPQQGTGSGK